MTEEKRIEAVKEVLESMDESDLMYIHNEYCDDVHYYDDRVYYVSELDELCYGLKPTEILDRYAEVAKYEFFTEGVYVNGSDYITDLIDIDEIAEYIVENEKDYGMSELEDLFDEWEEKADEIRAYIEDKMCEEGIDILDESAKNRYYKDIALHFDNIDASEIIEEYC